jgi:hypothetical protein
MSKKPQEVKVQNQGKKPTPLKTLSNITKPKPIAKATEPAKAVAKPKPRSNSRGLKPED